MPTQEITTSSPANQPAAGSGDVLLSKSAIRMRRYRQRKATGGVRVLFDLDPGGVDLMIELGWVAEADRRNIAAIQSGFSRLVNHAAGIGVRPETDRA